MLRIQGFLENRDIVGTTKKSYETLARFGNLANCEMLERWADYLLKKWLW